MAIKYRLTEIRWFFKKRYNRFILWRRLKKHYLAPWDIVDTLLNFCFETFCIFYEKSGLDDYVYWGNPNDSRKYSKEEVFEGEHKFLEQRWAVRQEIERLYIWWKILRPKHLKKLDTLYDYYFMKYPLNFNKKDNEYYEICKPNKSKKQKVLFNKICKIESRLLSTDTKNLHALITIKDYLWT